MITIERKDLIGELEGFPVEIVIAMIKEQLLQGNEANITLFQEGRRLENGRFNWHRSEDGYIFWDRILQNLEFDVFFKRYPKSLNLFCYKKRDFDTLIATSGVDPFSRYISICGTSGETWEGPELHILGNDLPNVLNLDFDDCTEVVIGEDEKTYIPISEEQGKQLFEFLEESEGKNLHIHCLAGKSRSQGIVRFCLDVYPERNYTTLKTNPPTTPNPEVVRVIKKAYYEKNPIEF